TGVGQRVGAPSRPWERGPRLGAVVVEGPVKLPPKPMPPVAGRVPEPAPPPHPGPLLPPTPDAPKVRRARAALGPFALRLQSLFEDRPEAVERLCAAIEARAALRGLDAALGELDRELSQPRWKGRRAPPGQLERLAATARAQLEPWTAAARLLLDRLRIERG